MDSIRIPEQPCPSGCGYKLDAVTNAFGVTRMPKEGDFSMCFGCGTFLTYEAKTWRVFTHDELVDLDTKMRAQLHKVHENWTYLKQQAKG